MARIVVGVSGASGIILAKRTVEALGRLGHDIELVFSQHALYTAALELGSDFKSAQKFVHSFPENIQKRITLHALGDVGATICSGSYPTDGMVIIPCSMASVAAVSLGLADNCLRRAADVTIKERRRLVIVPREAPLSEIHLEHMLKLAKMGVSIIPPIPAWYLAPKTMEEVETFIVGKALDGLRIPHELYPKWEGVSKM